MTSPQFVAFLHAKLAEAGAGKVIPDAATIDRHWRMVRHRRLAARRFDELKQKVADEAAALTLPADLAEQVHRLLKTSPWLAWDQAVAQIDPNGGADG
jgi:hypothetical protein